MKKKLAAMLCSVVLVLSMGAGPVFAGAVGTEITTEKVTVAVTTDDTNAGEEPEIQKIEKVALYLATLKNKTETLDVSSLQKKLPGKVTWTTSNKKVAKIVKKTKNSCKIKALNNGKAIITGKTDKWVVKLEIKVVTKSNDVKTFAKCWVKNNIKKGMTDKEKILTASQAVTHAYEYGNYYTAQDLLLKGKGTCVAGSQLVAEYCKAMGFKATVRSAVKDKKSRYPEYVFFGSNHYNVKVVANGKTYYTEGTPGCYFTYLSTSKKPLYYVFCGMRIKY